MALEGTPPWPVTPNARATWEMEGPDIPPVPSRESRVRVGVSGTYLAPVASAVKYPVTSKITWVVVPGVGATYVTESVPPPPRAAVIPLARSSFTGKLRVEEVGLFWATGPR